MDNSPEDGRANDWVYSKSGDAITSSFWQTNQPTDRYGNCVVLKKEILSDGKKVGKWANARCTTEANFICEFAPIAFCTSPGEINDPDNPKQCCMEDIANTGQCEGNELFLVVEWSF